jgi:hypothetical protein
MRVGLRLGWGRVPRSRRHCPKGYLADPRVPNQQMSGYRKRPRRLGLQCVELGGDRSQAWTRTANAHDGSLGHGAA